MKPTKGLPTLSHLQFLFMHCLWSNISTGARLRAHMKEAGVKLSLTSFYQMTVRLEKAKLIRSWKQTRMNGPQIIRETFYHLEDKGIGKLNDAKRFYADKTNCIPKGKR